MFFAAKSLAVQAIHFAFCEKFVNRLMVICTKGRLNEIESVL